jgi:hypothetical protein
MSILAAEISWFAPALVSDSAPASNGGRQTQTQIVSGVKNALFPDVSSAQRTAGATHWRKAFIGVRNADNLPLVDPKISIESGTPGDSYVLLYPGTRTDTEDEVVERPYGVGTLSADAALGATSLTVAVESADYDGMTPNPFQIGDLVRVDARPTVAGAGAFEYRTVASVGYVGSVMTLGIDALESAYTAADGVRIASVIEPGDLAAGYSALAATGGVTYDDTTYPVAVASIGGIYQAWTITITDATTGAFTLAGDTLGAMGTGATGAALAPVNPAGGVYFTLAAAGWGGTPVNGDTLEFVTFPESTGIWYKRIIPAGSAAISNDAVAVCIEGESA